MQIGHLSFPSILSLLGSTWAPVGLGDAEGSVILPVCSLAVLAAVKDQAAPGAVKKLLLAALAVLAGFSPISRGGLLLYLFGRHSKEGLKTVEDKVVKELNCLQTEA